MVDILALVLYPAKDKIFGRCGKALIEGVATKTGVLTLLTAWVDRTTALLRASGRSSTHR